MHFVDVGAVCFVFHARAACLARNVCAADADLVDIQRPFPLSALLAGGNNTRVGDEIWVAAAF